MHRVHHVVHHVAVIALPLRVAEEVGEFGALEFLGQFQGFNNSTHEYRINNIATGGSINFMTGSTSRFLVANNGTQGVHLRRAELQSREQLWREEPAARCTLPRGT